MAVLTDPQRIEIWSAHMRDLSSERERMPLSKPELRAAIDAVDDWIDANAAGYNNALPPAAKSELTAKQKARLLIYVASKRWEIG